MSAGCRIRRTWLTIRASCGVAGDVRGQAEQRLVADPAVPDDPLQNEGVLAVLAEHVELARRRSASSRKRTASSGGTAASVSCRRDADVRVGIAHHGQQGPEPVVALERKEPAGREKTQVARSVRGPDDRDDVLGPGGWGGRGSAKGGSGSLSSGSAGAGAREGRERPGPSCRAARARDRPR